MDSDLEIVNIVASGEVDATIDLPKVHSDLPMENSYIEGPGLYFKFSGDGPTVVVARTGKYIITGGSSYTEIEKTRTKVLNMFSEMGIIKTSEDLTFSVKNMVFIGEVNKNIDLSAATIHLGLEDTEYEPEQFPGLIYRPSEYDCVVLLFASGRVVITGSPNFETAEQTYEIVKEKVLEFSDKNSQQ